MAKKKYTIKQLLDLDVSDWMKFNKNDMLKALKTLDKQVTLRYNNVSKYNTPAYNYLKESGGNLNLSNTDTLNKLRNDFKRTTKFLKSKTSLVKGYKELEKKLYGEFSGKLTDLDKSKIWEIYRKIEQGDLHGTKLYGSDKAVQDVINMYYGNMSEEDIIQTMFDKFEENYEESEMPWEFVDDTPF